MTKLIKCEVVDGGYLATFRNWLGEETYFTTTGTIFYDCVGNRTGIMKECRLGDAFRDKYDYLYSKFWDYDTHPSPSMRARKHAIKASSLAKEYMK